MSLSSFEKCLNFDVNVNIEQCQDDYPKLVMAYNWIVVKFTTVYVSEPMKYMLEYYIFHCLMVLLFVSFLFLVVTRNKSRTLHTFANGYRTVSCNKWNCESKAMYAMKRNDIGIYCLTHKKDDMVKAFGCEVKGCKGRVFKGTSKKYCKRHYTAI